MDMFNKLPETIIIENILCRIPIQEAARTSILSKEWRYHWTKIPKLVFDEDTFQVLSYVDDVPPNRGQRVRIIQSQRGGKSYWSKLFYALYQILFKHDGPIHEFTLRVCTYKTCVELDYIMKYLSRNFSIKKLTLDIIGEYTLPLSTLSFHQLTDLILINCDLGQKITTFNVFDSLTNLYMSDGRITSRTLLHLLSSCPLLKSLTIDEDVGVSNDLHDDCTIANLFGCFSMLENLSICFSIIEDKFIDEDEVPQVLPRKLIRLKYAYIDEMCFMSGYGLPFLLFLIRNSPNMEKLIVNVNSLNHLTQPILQSKKFSSILEDCSNILLEHLNELEISITVEENKMPGLEFVKFILAKSPVLKKVKIYIYKVDKLQVHEVLLSSESLSPNVKIFVE